MTSSIRLSYQPKALLLLWASALYLQTILLLHADASNSDETKDNGADAGDSSTTTQCRLWLAPSYLSSSSGQKFGLYAGVDFNENDIIPDYEIGWPLYDILKYPKAQRSKTHSDTLDYITGMMWRTDYAATAKWEANASSTVFIPGVGVLVNYHTGFYNVDWYHGSVIGREPYLPPGVPSAARGSISPYYNITMKATRKIPMGMELFPRYGEVDPADDEQDESNIYQDKFTRADYTNADKILDRILDFFDKHEESMSADLKENVIDFMLENVLGGIAAKNAKIYRSLLPPTLKKLRQVKEAGGTFEYRYRDMVRSPKWFEKHAVCVDEFEIKESTVPHAGRGAFAKSSFDKDEIITAVPMIPILSEQLFQIYDTIETKDESKTTYMYDTSKPTGFQLMLNYAYGHFESTLHLLPVAPGVNFINHGPNPADAEADVKTANVYLEWSSHDYVYNDHSLHETDLSEWVVGETPSIVMTLVALVDIEEGDELLMDYGPEWEKSWNQYMAAWQQKWNASGTVTGLAPRRARDMQELYIEKPFPVDIRVGQQPYPNGVVSGVYLGSTPTDVPDGSPRRNAKGYDIMVWNGPEKFHELTGQTASVCDIVDRQTIYDTTDPTKIVSYNYTVITKLKNEGTDNSVQVMNVPHFAITLIDRPYTSDIHNPDSFRHWIAIRDSIFPQAWRDLR
jgi:hypothetical protein